MSTTEQSEHSELLPSTLYHIVVAFSGSDLDGRRLTGAEGHVTIAPPSAHPDPAQQWRIVHDGSARDFITIESPILPPPPAGIYLSYEGVPHPKEHAPVVVGNFETEWIHTTAPGFTYILRAKKDPRFAISVAPAHAPPRPDPSLILDDKNELRWAFEPIPPHVE